MKNFFCTIFILFLSFQVFAQTKLISHKSHSGNSSNFSTALEINFGDISLSDFGNPIFPSVPDSIFENGKIKTSSTKPIMCKSKIPPTENDSLQEKNNTTQQEENPQKENTEIAPSIQPDLGKKNIKEKESKSKKEKKRKRAKKKDKKKKMEQQKSKEVQSSLFPASAQPLSSNTPSTQYIFLFLATIAALLGLIHYKLK